MRVALLFTAFALALPAAAQGFASPFPPGAYVPDGDDVPPDARLVFGADGTVRLEAGGAAVAEGTYAASPGHLVLTLPGDGPRECDTDDRRSGIYAWAEADGVVTIDVVDDPCGDRAEALDGLTLTPDPDWAGAPAGLDGAFPTGSFRPGPPAPPTARLVFADDGTFRISEDDRDRAAGRFVATADHLVLTLDDGDCEAPDERTGLYTWALDGDTLALAAVDDACRGRVRSLTSVTFSAVDE